MSGKIEQGSKKTNALDAHVAGRLQMRRLTLGLTQEALGKGSGVAMQQIQKYETGQNRIPATRLFQFSLLLGVPVDWFFEGLDQRVAPDHAKRKKLEVDVVKLLESYRSIDDADHRTMIRRMANSLAKRGK